MTRPVGAWPQASPPSSGIRRPTWPRQDPQPAVPSASTRAAGYGEPEDDFLNHVILRLRSEYGSILGADFGEELGDLTGVTWYGPATTWPSNALNAAWIAFWRNLDLAIGDRLGMVVLGDDFWGTFTSGPLGSHVVLTAQTTTTSHRMEPSDQRGTSRPTGGLGDIGAIER
jgi:hypothetical protein